MNKLMKMLGRKYISAKIKVEDFMKKEDGMETLETIILVVVAVAVAALIISALQGENGLIPKLFKMIQDKLETLFGTKS